MNKGQSRTLMLHYIREATNKGITIDPAKTADYSTGHDNLLDSVHKEIALQIKISSVMSIMQNPIPNQLGLMAGFDLVQHKPNIDDTFSAQGTKAIYFEVCGNALIYIKENNTIIQTIINSSLNKFTPYRVIVDPQSDINTISVVFSGTMLYEYRNIGLFQYRRSDSPEDIPAYTPYVSYDMPPDFMEFDSITQQTDPQVYLKMMSYKWENNKKVILKYDDTGSFDIHYFKYPQTIETDAPNSTQLELEEKGAQLVPIKLAALVVAEDKPAISNKLLTLYEAQLSRASGKGSVTQRSVQTIYHIGG